MIPARATARSHEGTEMAADDEEFPEEEVEFEEDLVDADVDPDDLDEEELVDDEFGIDEDVEVVLDDEVAEKEEEEEVPAPRRVVAAEEEDDDEDLVDPDDVEADLDTILKDRLTTQDDDAADDDEEVEVDDRGDPVDRIQPKRPGEFVCQSCFLLKPPSQLANAKTMLCADCV